MGVWGVFGVFSGLGVCGSGFRDTRWSRGSGFKLAGFRGLGFAVQRRAFSEGCRS